MIWCVYLLRGCVGGGQMRVVLRLSLAVNVVFCSLGIFRVCLLHMTPADADRDVIVDVTADRRPQAPSNTTESEFLVPNIVHYIWWAPGVSVLSNCFIVQSNVRQGSTTGVTAILRIFRPHPLSQCFLVNPFWRNRKNNKHMHTVNLVPF